MYFICLFFLKFKTIEAVGVLLILDIKFGYREVKNQVFNFEITSKLGCHGRFSFRKKSPAFHLYSRTILKGRTYKQHDDRGLHSFIKEIN